MSAQLTPVLPVASTPPPASGSGSDNGSDNARPFASALDGALSAGRPPAQRAGSPGREARDHTDGPGSRAGGLHRGSGKAAGKAAHRADDRAADRAGAKATDKAAGRAADAVPGADPDQGPASDAAGSAPASGLPVVFWAVLQVPPPVAPTAAAADSDPTAVGAVPGPGAVLTGAAAAQMATAPLPVSGAVIGPAGTTAPPQLPTDLAAPTLPGASDATSPTTATTAPTPVAAQANPSGAALGDLVVVVAPTAGPSGVPGPGLPTTVTPAAAKPAAGGAPTPETPTAATAVDGTAPAVPTAALAATGGPAGGSAGSADDHDGKPSEQAPATVDATSPAPQVPGVPVAAPATQVAPVAASAAAQAPPPVAAQLVQHVVTLGRGPDGAHSMTVVLNPDNLGPVQIQVTVNQGSLDLTLRGAHDEGRAALMNALPDLRRDLQAAGLDPSRLDVSRDTGGSWTSQQSSAREGQQQGQPPWARPGWGENRARSWAQDTTPDRPARTPHRSASARGVDLLV